MMDIKRRVLARCQGTGIDQMLIYLYDSLAGLTFEISPRIRSFEGETPNGTVVMPLIPGYRNASIRFCVIADALRRRGYEPLLFYDDLTDVPFGTHVDDSHAEKAENEYFRRRIPAQFGLEPIGITDILTSGYDYSKGPKGDPLESEIKRFARGSTRKHHKIYTIDLDDDETAATYRSFCNGAKAIADATRAIIETNDVATLVAHEPYYVHGGVPMRVAANNGVYAYSLATGYRPATLMFGREANRSLLPQYTDDAIIDRVLSRPLTRKESDEIDEIMANWETGTDIAIMYTADTNRSVESSKDLVGLFTNLLWDASLEPDSSVYENVYNWVSDTIEVLGGRNDVELLIKTHPAEKEHGTNESVSSWFRSTYDEPPENVRLLPPDTDVNTYELLDSLDVCIVYNSTVGFEAAFRGLPVIVSGETHYKGHGLTIDPDSVDTYTETVANYETLECTQEMQSRARRYAHLLLVKRHFPFPYDRKGNVRSNEFEPLTPKHTRPGVTEFDSLIDAIVNGREVMATEYEDLARNDVETT